MPATTKYALRYPAATDPADVPADMQNLASDVESALDTKGHAVELAYAQITAAVSITSTAEATGTDIVAAPAVTADGSTALLIEFFTPIAAPAAIANESMAINIYENGANVGRIALVTTPTAAQMTTAIYGRLRRTPAAGSRTYKAGGWRVAGNGIVGGAVGPYLPTFIRVSRV